MGRIMYRKKMAKVKDLTMEDLEYLIRQKILEVPGDPDYGLELKEEFKEKLKERLRSSSEKVSHKEVIRK